MRLQKGGMPQPRNECSKRNCRTSLLDGYIKFTDIAKINQVSVEQMPSSTISSIDDVLAVDKQARELAASLIKKLM